MLYFNKPSAWFTMTICLCLLLDSSIKLRVEPMIVNTSVRIEYFYFWKFSSLRLSRVLVVIAKCWYKIYFPCKAGLSVPWVLWSLCDITRECFNNIQLLINFILMALFYFLQFLFSYHFDISRFWLFKPVIHFNNCEHIKTISCG